MTFVLLLFLYLSLLELTYERSLVAWWVDDEPAACVVCRLTHPLRGWGVVDEGRKETVDRIARYRTDY